MDERRPQSNITRKFMPWSSHQDCKYDDDGFVDPFFGALSLEDLMRSESRAFLVRGRPWIGKSYLFDATCGQRNDLNLGTFFWMTQLQDHPQGKDIVPGTWNE